MVLRYPSVITTFSYILFWQIVLAEVNKQKPCTAATVAKAYENLPQRINEIKQACGSVCVIPSVKKVKYPKGPYFDAVWKNIDCQGLFENATLLDKPTEFPASPKLDKLSKDVQAEFKWSGRANILDDFFLTNFGGLNSTTIKWPKSTVDSFQDQFRKGLLKGNYGRETVSAIGNLLRKRVHVENKHVLVIGSETPWIEAILLELGAKHVTTMEYSRIITNHPQLTTVLPEEMVDQYLAGTLPKYDVLVTFSSVEHSGLGRYGDELNPWGDIITMARAWCVLKPMAKVVLGVPYGSDFIIYNAGKMYGPKMLPQLMANFRQLYSEIHRLDRKPRKRNVSAFQPLHLLEKAGSLEDMLS